tara:strand:+ start:4591 stop:4791 length:201 start_codon:yes stop_codon:yes gene_type:complete
LDVADGAVWEPGANELEGFAAGAAVLAVSAMAGLATGTDAGLTLGVRRGACEAGNAVACHSRPQSA